MAGVSGRSGGARIGSGGARKGSGRKPLLDANGQRVHQPRAASVGPVFVTSQRCICGNPLRLFGSGRLAKRCPECSTARRDGGFKPVFSTTKKCPCGNPLPVFHKSSRVANRCSPTCHKKFHPDGRPVTPLTVCWLRKCWDCGCRINARSAFCKPCIAAKQAQGAEARRQARNAKQNAKRRGAYINGTVDPIAVFKRDDWTCKGCGCETPAVLRGTRGDNAPEVDHIIPIARGGAHSYENVQTLCRVCNILKGANDMDEFAAAYFCGSAAVVRVRDSHVGR